MELRRSDGAQSIGIDLWFSKTPMTNIKNRRVEKLWAFEARVRQVDPWYRKG